MPRGLISKDLRKSSQRLPWKALRLDLPRVGSKVWPHHYHDFACSKETVPACRGLVYPRHGRRPTVDHDLSPWPLHVHAGQLETLRFRPTRRSAPSLQQNLAQGVRTIAIVLDGHLVMPGQLPVTIHDDQGSLYKDHSTTNLPWWRLVQPSNSTVWTLNDRFFASLGYCMLPRHSPNTGEKKLKIESFVFGW